MRFLTVLFRALRPASTALRFFVVTASDQKRSLSTLSFEIDSRDQLLAGKHRQAIVAVFALRRGFEDLEQQLETKKLLGPLAIPKQGVEG